MKYKIERNLSMGEVLVRIIICVGFGIIAGFAKGLGAPTIYYSLVTGAFAMYFFITALSGWDPVYMFMHYHSNHN